jgi:aspartate-semialdehyde dehydrogenase
MIRHLAIVGATGAVGREVCAIIAEGRVKVDRLTLLASKRSAGAKVEVAGRSLEVGETTQASFEGVQYAIFSAGAERARQFAPAAVRAGTVVIDNSSAFRMDADTPLVVPEINPHDANGHRGVVSVPNCSAIILAMPVWPLHRVNPVRRIVVSTYQAASGAGAAAMEELRTQTADFLAGRKVVPRVLPHQIAFNLFSHNTPIGPDGYNTEERKVVEEMRKIFHAPDLAIAPTCIRVPVLRAHSESVTLTFERPMTPDECREILRSAPGVEVIDDAAANRFPMPLDASGRDACFVGRIRQDVSQPDGRGIQLFICGDQLRKGAALNAIQIIELLERR